MVKDHDMLKLIVDILYTLLSLKWMVNIKESIGNIWNQFLLMKHTKNMKSYGAK